MPFALGQLEARSCLRRRQSQQVITCRSGFLQRVGEDGPEFLGVTIRDGQAHLIVANDVGVYDLDWMPPGKPKEFDPQFELLSIDVFAAQQCGIVPVTKTRELAQGYRTQVGAEVDGGSRVHHMSGSYVLTSGAVISAAARIWVCFGDPGDNFLLDVTAVCFCVYARARFPGRRFAGPA
ncbi:hypothetical protein, partial [Marivita sp.]|uniref:hypothetical protein n=1 Tax=Marivita sp. TaxID=2003365 RepID=UPI0025BCB367